MRSSLIFSEILPLYFLEVLFLKISHKHVTGYLCRARIFYIKYFDLREKFSNTYHYEKTFLALILKKLNILERTICARFFRKLFLKLSRLSGIISSLWSFYALAPSKQMVGNFLTSFVFISSLCIIIDS